MNDEASSSTRAGTSTAPDLQTLQDDSRLFEDLRAKNRQAFNRKRVELLDDLRRNVDILIYAELSIIYYMDCAFLKFFLRSMAQLIFLTPKPSMFPEPPTNLPFLGVIVGGNALAILLHIWSNAPSAGEATAGYLHGGLAIDFIGQKGPTSKWALVFLDLIVVFFQLVQLSTFHARRNLKADIDSTGATAATTTTTEPNTTQDLDSEERGVHRAQESQDIELQTLNPDAFNQRRNVVDETDEPNDENESLVESTIRTDLNILDAFHSGQIIAADMNITKAIGQELEANRTRTPESIESARIMRANLARQLLRWRLGSLPVRAG